MRDELEVLRAGNVIQRLIYHMARIGHSLLPSGRRQRIKEWFFKVTRHRPSYCRRVREWGLCDSPRLPRVIVSLTSYPKRIGTVHRVVEALLTQTFKPDMVVLWLAESQFPNREADLPRELLRMKQFGLTIDWCEDMRSYKKLVPSLRKYPDDIIVTSDDDIFVPPDWLGRLYSSYLKEKEAVHCHYVSSAKMINGSVAPWGAWGRVARGSMSYRNSLWGCAGVLYPPHSLHPDVVDVDTFEALAPNADDLWFWAMAVLNKRKVKLADEALCKFVGDFTADNSEALMNVNTGSQKLNDVQLRNILNAYPSVESRIKEGV